MTDQWSELQLVRRHTLYTHTPHLKWFTQNFFLLSLKMISLVSTVSGTLRKSISKCHCLVSAIISDCIVWRSLATQIYQAGDAVRQQTFGRGLRRGEEVSRFLQYKTTVMIRMQLLTSV